MFCRMRTNFLRPTLLAAALACSALTSPAHAQYRMDALPPGAGQDLSMPQIINKAGAQLPLDTSFTSSDGKPVTLASLFHHDRPVIVSMVYFSCPFLCGENQNSLVDSVLHGPRDLSLGKDYDIVVISIDPDDTPAAAQQKHDHYLGLMNRKPTDPGLTYLTGSEKNIRQVADTLGFGFKRNWTPDNKFAHQPGVFICTPDGKLSHTITGLLYEPDELHFRLVEASNGKIGSSFASLPINCGAMRFNPLTGRYEANPYFWVGSTTGLLTILMLGGALLYLYRTTPKQPLTSQPTP